MVLDMAQDSIKLGCIHRKTARKQIAALLQNRRSSGKLNLAVGHPTFFIHPTSMPRNLMTDDDVNAPVPPDSDDSRQRPPGTSLIIWQCPNCGQSYFGEQPPDMCDYCQDFTTWRRVNQDVF
jgi:hypothetical protein